MSTIPIYMRNGGFLHPLEHKITSLLSTWHIKYNPNFVLEFKTERNLSVHTGN